jgi:hypothetical protein
VDLLDSLPDDDSEALYAFIAELLLDELEREAVETKRPAEARDHCGARQRDAKEWRPTANAPIPKVD